MNPSLFRLDSGVDGIGDLILPSYFSMVAIGFIIAVIVIPRWAKRHGIDSRVMIDFIIWMAIFGLLGSRLLHIIADGHFWDYVNVCIDPQKVDWKIDARECRQMNGVWDAAKGVCHPAETNCLAWADITNGGLAFYGGFLAAALFSIVFVRRYQLPVGKLVDMGGWLLMLGLAWGRMGCFLGSCCFGARTDSWFGVVFPRSSSASRYHWEQGLLANYRTESLPVHPTQVYEALVGIAIAALAYFWLRPRKKFDGQVFCVASILYAVARFLLETVRRDERGGLFGFSTSQLIAMGIVVCCILLWRYFSERSQRIVDGTETAS